LHNGDGIIPRMEILEYCTSMLLNLNEWNSVVFNDKRFASLELCSAFAVTIIDIDKFKGIKKLNREAWDLVLPMFSAQSQKRQTAMRDSPTLLVASNLNPFLKKLRDPTIVAIVLSLLAKLHNVLKDESNLDINCEYLYLWPATISK
jgi:integrator complex subunit 8